MADEFDGGAVSVMEEELRPPESWPGAGGLRSVAPDVPAWPTGPISGLSAPEGSVTAAPRKKGTGEGWPGAGGPAAFPVASGTSTSASSASAASSAAASSGTERVSTRGEAREKKQRSAGGHPAMGPSILLLVACIAIAAWVLLDSGSRAAQASVLAVVLIVGGVFVARTLRRPRGGRTKQ